MRISDWSSDVCSSDLPFRTFPERFAASARRGGHDLVFFSQVFFNSGYAVPDLRAIAASVRSEEHTSELQSLMRISYAVFCLKKKTQTPKIINYTTRIKHHPKC